MLNPITAFLSRFATGKYILTFLVVFMLINALILPWAGARIEAYSNGAAGPLDLQFSYPPEKAHAMVEAYGSEGRQFYTLIEVTVDIIYPIVTLLLFGGLIIYTYGKAFPDRPGLKNLALVSAAGTLLDFLENIGIVTMLTSYPNKLDAVAQLTSLITTGKWVLAVGGMVIAAVGLILWLVKRLTKR